MKLSLLDLFQVDHDTLTTHYSLVDTITAHRWAINRLQELINNDLYNGDWIRESSHSDFNYRMKSIHHYQGNLEEMLKASNTAVRSPRVEPTLDDLKQTTV